MVYDRDCRIQARQMVLDERQVGAIGHCSNEGCVLALVAFGAVSAVTAVVSGSIVVVGNVAYWFEKRSNCRPIDPDLDAAGSAGPPGAPPGDEAVPPADAEEARRLRGEQVPSAAPAAPAAAPTASAVPRPLGLP